MAKSYNQKLKILYLMELFWQCSDEDHVISIREMVDYLADKGIRAERKSLYDDIEALKLFGMKIENRRERPAGYYLAGRIFDREDCALMINLVQSSTQITERKARDLTKKIEKIAPKVQGELDYSMIQLPDRIRLMDHSQLPGVDLFREAMARNKCVSFRKAHLFHDEKKVMHRYGETIVFSPWQLLFDGERYRVKGYGKGQIENYYLDEISYLNILERDRETPFEE